MTPRSDANHVFTIVLSILYDGLCVDNLHKGTYFEVPYKQDKPYLYKRSGKELYAIFVQFFSSKQES